MITPTQLLTQCQTHWLQVLLSLLHIKTAIFFTVLNSALCHYPQRFDSKEVAWQEVLWAWMLTSNPLSTPYYFSGSPKNHFPQKAFSDHPYTTIWVRFTKLVWVPSLCFLGLQWLLCVVSVCFLVSSPLLNKTRNSRAIHLWVPRTQCRTRPRVNGNEHSLIQRTGLMKSILGLHFGSIKY